MENAPGGRGRTVLTLRRWGLAAGCCGLGWITLFAGLGSFGLVGPDEPRYAAIAAGMARTGDWITPHLWGAVWLEKPALYYWLAALSDVAHRAVNAATSRLPNALLAAGMLGALFFFLRRERCGRAGWLAVIIGLSSVFVFAFGRAATTDMTLTAPFAAGMMCLYLWLRSGRQRWLNLAALGFALAVLAKGPVALVLGALALGGYAALTGRWKLFPALFRPRAVIVFFAVAAPWYALCELRNPGFFRAFFLRQNLERMATNLYQHPQPIWFYVPVILLAVFPWTGWLGVVVTAEWRRRDELRWFLLCWLAAPLVFFTFSASKLPGYILPAVPAAVGLIAVSAEEQWGRLPRWALATSAVLAGLIPAAVRLTPWLLASGSRRLPLGAVLERNAGIWVLGGVCILVLLYFALTRRAGALVAATVIVVAASVLVLTRAPLSATLDVALSGRPLARSLYAQCGTALPQSCGGVPVYTWHLNRGLRYGGQFSLGGVLAPWPEATPPPEALIVLDRRAAMPLQMRLGAQGYNVAAQPRFIPAEATQAPPWMVVRVKRR